MPFRQSSKPIKVLHVDDDEWQLNMLKELIQTFDNQIEVNSINDSLKVTEVLRSNDYDCIITDFQMPNMNGIDLAKEIRKESSIPIIIYTGQGSEEVAEKAFAVGINDYFRKEVIPQHYQVIAKRIRNIVEKQRIENVYSHIVKDAKDSIAILVDGKVAFVNDALLNLLEASSDGKILGKTGIDLLFGIDKREAEQAVKSLLDGTQNQLDFDLEIKKSNGKLLPVVINASVIDFLGEKGILCFLRDITERKAFETKIKKSEIKFRTLVELAPDGIMTVTRNGDITWINEEFSRITGYSAQEIVGKKVWSIKTIRALDIPKFVRVFYDLLRGGSIPTVEFQWIHKEGKTGWGEGRASAVKIENEMTEILLFVRDITERKKLETDIKKYSSNVELLEKENTMTILESEKILDEDAFKHSIINELKGTLNTIVNAIYLMDAKPEKCEEMKHTILDAVENASTLMSQVHETATPERLDLEEVDIANLIDIIVSTILVPSDIDVHLALEKQIIRIDRGKMGHALINILTNAVEMLPSKGLLKISTTNEGDHLVIEIKNSGIGIPLSSKTSQTSSDHPELASSRKIIKAHGGDLEIVSELGIGTTMKIILPLQLYNEIPQKPKTRDGAETSNQG